MSMGRHVYGKSLTLELSFKKSTLTYSDVSFHATRIDEIDSVVDKEITATFQGYTCLCMGNVSMYYYVFL